MGNNKSTILVAVFTLAVTLFVACGSDSDEIVEVVMIVNPVRFDSIDELVEKSDAVVTGTFSGKGIAKEFPAQDSGHSGYGSTYRLIVEEYLMGSGPNSLDLYQPEGSIIPGPNGDPFVQVDSNAIPPPEVEQRYLLFIRYSERNPEIVTGSALPYRFVLKDGMSRPDPSRSYFQGPFPRPEVDLIAEIESAIRTK
ncbi:MAG: hypothetical protein HQ478_15060 [Chloroflexi bacterium]|nr:hypothetical protein [Chloroflexota bacterium]